MKNQWIYYYSGMVSVKVTGKGLERFINTLTREQVSIWKVKRHGVHAMSFEIKVEDAHKIRKVVRNSGCKIEFQRRTGLPFLIKRAIKNMGFFIGAFLFLVVITLLSNMVWGIEIKGADPATEYKIRKTLDEIGVKKGKFQWSLGTPEAIQKSITESMDELTWIGVELQGTTYHLQVVEKNEPEKQEEFGPQNLVAKKKATIVDYFVEEGKPLVSLHEVVSPGEVLVSGAIGREGEEQLVPARGEVLGETWYWTEVDLPLSTNFQVYTGNETRKHAITIGNIKIPVWGFGKVEYKESVTEENNKPIKFLKWNLPVSYQQSTIRESENETRVYTEKQAYTVAREMARKDIKSLLPEDAKIKGEKVLRQLVKNGKVNLIVHFQVIENIAEPQPITQGDSE
ncbi:sporulation protein YqfD [Robertmurraya korlensis]|uniref:sporulation protein YqfD n=1 Tax=Robertmurraya korlensis TaxID=519977 RepID=UPI000825AA6E|nr:sporulation protein YqfD [Robertmurraya korlensis]